MPTKSRPLVSVAVLLVLAVCVVLARWYAQRRAAPAQAPSVVTLAVISAADRGSGTLREALYAADMAPSPARIVVHVERIELQSELPPLVSSHAIEIVAPDGGLEIDARALQGGPVFDIGAEHVILSGLRIRHCPASAILVRAAHFRLSASSLEGCDVGVEVAPTATDVRLERNSFDADRIGIRFTGPSADSEVMGNEFAGASAAGVWLVASAPMLGTPIRVHDNHFRTGVIGIVLGNVPALLEHNEIAAQRAAAIQVVGAGAVIRANHVSGGAAGIVVENGRSAWIEGNELDHLEGYGVLLRGAADTLVRGNRVQNCGYGLGFMLGDAQHPNTATENVLTDLRYNGIDVIGESPVLRQNRVSQARAYPLHVADFAAADGTRVHAQPLLERNSFQLASTAGVTRSAARR